VAALFGIDLGGTNTKVGLVGPKGIINLASIPTRVDLGPQAWLERLIKCTGSLLNQAGIDPSGMQGAGIDSPGGLDPERTKIVFAPNLKTFNGYPLRDSVEKALSLPTVLENDANAYAYGEFYFGAGKGCHDLICITLGTGVGGGIIINQEIVTGPMGIGGELGHITVEPDGRVCGCGNQGCIESYASATGFRGMLAEALKAGRQTSLKAGDDVKEMAGAAGAGDKVALEMFDKAAVALGRGVASMVVATGIDLYVVGAGISRSFEPLMKKAFEKELKKRLCMADPALIRVVTSTLGNKAAVMGAAAWAARCLKLNWQLDITD
jgi:glucokinase